MQAPAPRLRPLLARWMFERRLRWADAKAPLKRSHEYVRRLCLEFDDPKRIEPTDEDLALIVVWTAGDITGDDFDRAKVAARLAREAEAAERAA